METETQKNKRIAKNTLLLYVRMAFSMVVSLYTSRVVLNALGVEDYGTYGVVGGLVTFFNVISGSLNAAISRFITVELGKRDVRRLNEVFCTSVNIQLLMSVLLVVLVEVAGVWFLHEKMSIPDGRMDAAYWVLQLSILSFVVSLLGVPYNATIIAHEHMGAYAYLSLLSTFLNLGVALVISWVSFDKLIFYAGAIVAIQLVMQLIYVAYCRFHFEETKLRLLFYRSMMKEMTGFAGWNFLGASSGVMMGQGINLLINLFFGVVVNAARGIAGTVDNALNMLVNHFTMALSPQIMKSYAAGDMKYMHQLICKGAKYSFFIMFVPALPILLETRQVLVLWLKQVPDEAVVFTRLAMMISLVSVLSQTLITSMLATGKIRKYQIVISSLSYAVFGLAFVAFYMGYPAYVCYLIQLVIFIIELGVRLYLLRGMISLPVMTFVREVLMKIVWVVMASVAIPLSLLLVLDESYVRLAALVPVSAICALLFVYFAGLSSEERMWVHQQARGAVEKLTIDN